MRGRLGGRFLGADVRLVGDASPLLMALAAVLAYAALLEDNAGVPAAS